MSSLETPNCTVAAETGHLRRQFRSGYKTDMDKTFDWFPMAAMLANLILASWAIKAWADMASCESRVGKWVLGVMASAFSVLWVATLATFIWASMPETGVAE